jgi:hypothetical protein
MPKGMTPRKQKLNDDANDLVAELGITPMTVDEIAAKYGRTKSNVHYSLLPRARKFGRMNNIVIERPIPKDGWLYKARWDWETQQPGDNWLTMLTDFQTRSANMRDDISSYAANASAEGKADLADQLEDVFDLFKVTTRSIAKARLLVEGELTPQLTIEA